MGDIKGLTDKWKLKENKYVMDAGKLKIGKGMISYDENILIPFHAISFVEIPEPEKGGAGTHALRIQNHAGTCFYIAAPDPDFIREIRSALIICMNDRNAIYNATERVIITEAGKFYGDKITAAGDIHIDNTRHLKAATPEKKNTATAGTITILDDEWETLKDYSLKRMKDFSPKERNYTVCEALAASAELKNREKCKKILEVSGNDALDMIIAGAPISIKAIVNKLM
ncbi:MAG: hypothetical protein NC416_14180 [Eubacterium sp.]|nr:hypothetical protein [Eubacterium sp.]